MSVLVLNASYEVINTVSLQKAIRLIERAVVDVLAVAEKPIRTASALVDRPEVIRLKQYHNVPRRNAKWSRRGVLRRDSVVLNGTRWVICSYCGVKLTFDEATIDHILPQARLRKQGVLASTWGNTCASCIRCQKRKADKNYHEVGMTFREGFIAKTPRTSYVVVSANIPDSWKIYLEK